MTISGSKTGQIISAFQMCMKTSRLRCQTLKVR